MSEQATVTDITERVRRKREPKVRIGETALMVALQYIRQQKQIALIADEMEIASSWDDEEKILMAARENSSIYTA